jgi:hypothetical protein
MSLAIVTPLGLTQLIPLLLIRVVFELYADKLPRTAEKYAFPFSSPLSPFQHSHASS